MGRSAGIEGFISADQMPKSLLATCYDGHLFTMEINPYNGRVVVRYPRDIYVLQVIGKCFPLLDSVSLFDDMRFYPDTLLDKSFVLTVDEEC